MNEMTTIAIVGVLAFGLHLYGRYGTRKEKQAFFPWLKDQVGYILSSAALCTIGILLRDEVMEPLGFAKEGTYVFILCYGAGHAVSRVLGMKHGAEERKAQAAH